MDAPDRSREVDAPAHVLLVPLKGFGEAKERLAVSLDAEARRSLAERLARGVLEAAGDLPVVVVCTDDHVASWARGLGASALQPHAGGLVEDLTEVCRALTDRGAERITIAPGDLARPGAIRSVLDRQLGEADGRTVLVVPDRRADGTNLLSLPTGVGFRFRYGPGSAAAHIAEAERLGLPVVLAEDPDLAWDVDLPDDLPDDRPADPPGAADPAGGAGTDGTL
ncbi:MAG: hypothetical protein KGR17_02710 [Acidobacteria bacterium]|nr:hypothetical protein [Acidobacteriota bacterium]